MAAGSSGGDSEFAATVKAGRWPSPEILDRLADAHEQQGSALRTAYNRSCDVHRPRLQQALQGQAGEAQFAAHNANVHLWDTHADLYTESGNAVRNAADELRSLQHDLRLLIEDKEPQYQAAIRSGKTVAAQAILTETLAEADGMVTNRTGTATMYVRGVNFTAPLPDRPVTDPDGQNGENGNPHHDKRTDPGVNGKEAPGENAPAGSTDGQDQAGSQQGIKTDLPPGTSTSALDASGLSHDIRTDLPPGVPPNGAPSPATSPLNQVPQFLGGSMGRAASGGGGAGAGGGGSALSGLGSNPGSMGSGLGSGMPTSPASSLPSASPAQASPMANAGSSFQSGLASGMGSVASPPPVAQQPIAQQAMAAQQSVMGSPAVGSGPAGVPIAPHSVPDGGGGGPVGSSAGSVGGGPMVPPAAMGGGGPLAPYSAPSAGPSSPGGGASTSAASGGQSSSGGAAPSSGGGLTAPGPLVSGGSGSGLASGALGASSSEVNPDLLLAQRVLAELVRGSAAYPTLVLWAVAVLRSAQATQLIIGSDIGDGGYVPSSVFVPYTARLAVADPMVPFGWGRRWMGNRHPVKALVDHFEHVGKKVAGVSMSALVTNEPYAVAPDCARDFCAVNHVAALNMLSVAPVLDGEHQHRLTALDPVLAQRVAALPERGYDPKAVAWELTRYVIAAAEENPEEGGYKLVTEDEKNVLAAVYRGSADQMSWTVYEQLVWQRDNGALITPETHGVEDVDGSELNAMIAAVYRRFYRAARIAELVGCWQHSPPSLADVAYCGVQAGFGSVVAAVISTLEMQAAPSGVR